MFASNVNRKEERITVLNGSIQLSHEILNELKTLENRNKINLKSNILNIIKVFFANQNVKNNWYFLISLAASSTIYSRTCANN